MNKYGRLLMEQWTIADPFMVESLEDPTEHFTQMGEQVQAEILETETSLAQASSVGETYLQTVGRLNVARKQAEEAVLAEYLPPSDSSTDEPEGWDEMSHDQQEIWIQQYVPNGPERDEMMQELGARRASRAALHSTVGDPENLTSED